MRENNLTKGRATATKAIVLITSFVAMLNETSINVALSELMGVFCVGVSTVQWLVTGFMLVMAVIVPITAYIIQSFKDRAIYFCSLALLVAGACLAGLAPSFGILLLGRLVQAAGTCCLMTLTMNVMIHLSTNENRGGALGLVGLVSLFAPALAPSLSGLVLGAFGWRWIFLGMIPLFLLLALAAALLLKDSTPTSKQSFDVASVALIALAFGGLLAGVGGSGESGSGFGTLRALAAGIGAASLALLIVRQLRLQSPLLDLRLFKSGMFSLGMVGVFFCIMTTFGLTVLMPMLFMQGFGLTAALAGLAMMPGCVLNGVASPIFGKLCDRFGPRSLVRIGSCAMAASALAFALMPEGARLGAYISIQCVFLIAIAAVSTASQANGMNHVPPASYPHGTAIMSTLMQLGGGFGSAIYATLFAAGMESSRGAVQGQALVLAGFHRAFLFGAMLLAIPLVSAFFVEADKAEPR